jgi:hypothetical protein
MIRPTSKNRTSERLSLGAAALKSPAKSHAPIQKVYQQTQTDRLLDLASRQFSYFFFTEIVFIDAVPPPGREAYRDRHGRGKRDAVDALARQTNVAGADGEGVWS